jgi:hypothetical protein
MELKMSDSPLGEELYTKIVHISPKVGDILFVEIAPSMSNDALDDLVRYMQVYQTQIACPVLFIPAGMIETHLGTVEQMTQIRDSIDAHLKKTN